MWYTVLGTVNGGEVYSSKIIGAHMTGLTVRTAVPNPGAKLTAVASDVEWMP